MDVRAVFFDMDDTLIDGVTATQAAWGIACAEVAARSGHDAQSLREAIGAEGRRFWEDESKVESWRIRLHDAREEIVRRALVAEGLDPAPAREISGRYLDEHRAHLFPFPDAVETLEALRSDGMKLALLTNGPAEFQRAKVERYDFARHFDVVVIEGEFGKGKPHPEVFAHALETLDVRPEETWHVGDNLYADVGGARAAGIHAVWIHRGRLTRIENPPFLPDLEIEHLAELREALGLGVLACRGD